VSPKEWASPRNGLRDGSKTPTTNLIGHPKYHKPTTTDTVRTTYGRSNVLPVPFIEPVIVAIRLAIGQVHFPLGEQHLLRTAFRPGCRSGLEALNNLGLV